MSSLATRRMEARATDVEFNEAEMIVRLADGRTIAAPLEWFPLLRDASPAQRAEWRLIGSGVGLSWEALDEDISVAGLLAV